MGGDLFGSVVARFGAATIGRGRVSRRTGRADTLVVVS